MFGSAKNSLLIKNNREGFKTMETQKLYIIDPNHFKGQIINTMSSTEGTPMYVDYMDKLTTLEDYKLQEGNADLVSLTWGEFEKDYYRPYLNSICKPFQEVTEKEFREALECLPPKRWTKEGNREFFFIGECTTAYLYVCYVRDSENYFTALRSIHTPKEDLLNRKDVK